MDRTGWVRGGDRSAGQPMQRSGWIRAARYIAESFWRSVIVAPPVAGVDTRVGPSPLVVTSALCAYYWVLCTCAQEQW